ncbi:hypothetical protein MGI18_20045 [Bacillus sp. OVS6]|nr:hypothetical protein MGI18_20045 [Bacillus sp. OVS6]
MAYYQKSYAFKYPKQLYQQKEQQLDDLVESLQKESLRSIQLKKDNYDQLKKRLYRLHPREQIHREKEKHQQLIKKMTRDMSVLLRQKQTEFQSMAASLNALSPLKIMERGYSIAYQDEDLVKSISQVKTGDKLHIQMQDGHVNCQVTGVEERKAYE